MSAASGPLYCADRDVVARVKQVLAGVAVGFAAGTAFGIMAAVLRGGF